MKILSEAFSKLSIIPEASDLTDRTSNPSNFSPILSIFPADMSVESLLARKFENKSEHVSKLKPFIGPIKLTT
jgi:hypothetical protein